MPLAIAAPKRDSAPIALIQQYGEPTLTQHLANGNTLYVFLIQYEKNTLPSQSTTIPVVVSQGQTIGINVPNQTLPNRQPIKCSITYEVSKKGIIVGKKEQGSCR